MTRWLRVKTKTVWLLICHPRYIAKNVSQTCRLGCLNRHRCWLVLSRHIFDFATQPIDLSRSELVQTTKGSSRPVQAAPSRRVLHMFWSMCNTAGQSADRILEKTSVPHRSALLSVSPTIFCGRPRQSLLNQTKFAAGHLVGSRVLRLSVANFDSIVSRTGKMRLLDIG